MKDKFTAKVVFREAKPEDIKQIQMVRNAVNENVLSVPGSISDKDCLDFITKRGKGWVGIADNQIIGFSIADLKENNIWALFVHPAYEKKGIGRQLHNIMLDWYFGQTTETVWLGTAPETRAEVFYRKSGWAETGIRGNGEIQFEMTYSNWKKLSR
ncbi:GNAT family N-acetyltransferase [Maribellus maritimus]|uniref:GNAT family N-acetyltransferase n=1 Tax=Maribellus maritimus TaxID=2870838 RepID=UPI001EEB2A42|nr:GNAT family N-acetyltransferase [Maribellus maritimus]MCG6187662.1 GNAT family N-acetyltransferase [Maribellus maritimus]